MCAVCFSPFRNDNVHSNYPMSVPLVYAGDVKVDDVSLYLTGFQIKGTGTQGVIPRTGPEEPYPH